MSTTDHVPAGGREGTGSLLSCMRRLTALADSASEPEQVFRVLARALMVMPGAEEVHVHHLGSGGEDRDLVVVYLFDGDGRLSYLCPRGERPPGVSWVATAGRSFLAAGERELLAGLPQLARRPGTVRSALLSPLVVRGETEAVVVLVSQDDGRFGEGAIEAAGMLVDQAATALALVQARAEAGTDAVTGCMNHRAMRRRLREEVGRAERTGGRLACLLLDLDDFKLVNDRHGHQAGDAVLRAVAETLMGEFRAFDRVARYGGDEFVVILPEADLQSALGAGERAMGHLERLQSPPVAGEGVGASIGVAQWQQGMSVEDLLAACDAGLLQGKREGKRRVIAAG